MNPYADAAEHGVIAAGIAHVWTSSQLGMSCPAKIFIQRPEMDFAMM